MMMMMMVFKICFSYQSTYSTWDLKDKEEKGANILMLANQKDYLNPYFSQYITLSCLT